MAANNTSLQAFIEHVIMVLKIVYSDIYIKDNDISNLSYRVSQNFGYKSGGNQFFKFGLGKKGETKVFQRS